MMESGARSVENRIHLFDPVGLINDTYGAYGGSNHVKARKATATRSQDSFSGSTASSPRGGGGLRFAVDHDSEASSPRLWKQQPSPSSSPNRAIHVVSGFAAPTQPIVQLQNHYQHLPHINYQYHNQTLNHHNQNVSQQHYSHNRQPQVMSPSSRTEVIARGRRELMEMIKDMPESFYELSLKDIVEQTKQQRPHSPHQSPTHLVNKTCNDDDDKFTTKEVVTVIETSSSSMGKNPSIMSVERGKETPKQQKKLIKKKKKEEEGSSWTNKKVKKCESKKTMVKDSSEKTRRTRRFILRTSSVFPISLGWKKKKKKKKNNNNNNNMTPKQKKTHLTSIASFKMQQQVSSSNSNPHRSTAVAKKMSMEKDSWWSRKSCKSSETDNSCIVSQSSGSSSSASSSRTSSNISRYRETRRFLPTCCSFFYNKRSIKTKN